MKRTIGMSILATVVGVMGAALAEVPIELSYALEDAAFQAVTQMNASPRVKGAVKNIAFVKMWQKHGVDEMQTWANEALVFEAALAATPSDLNFVVHVGHEADWKLIDEIFVQAADFSTWDPKTCPKLKQLKLCDAILTAHLIAVGTEPDTRSQMVRLALRLIKISSAEEIWSGIVNGTYSASELDDEKIDPRWRKAFEACAADAVAKLPARLDGYGLLLLPIEGREGKELGQMFLNALTAAGRQEKIRVYDLPNGSASDRMLARFLRERAGSGVSLSESVMKRVETLSEGIGIKSGKLALMSGKVSVLSGGTTVNKDTRSFPLDPSGKVSIRLASTYDPRHEVIADFKFRDVNDNFRLIGSIGATGVYSPHPPKGTPSFLDTLLAHANLIAIVMGGICVLAMLLVVCKILKVITRAR